MKKIKIGFIPSHRNIFSNNWAINMKERTLKSLSKNSLIEIVTPTKEITTNGLVENEEDAKKTIELFRDSNIDALLIGTMTFGEELPIMSIAEVFKSKPIMLFGTKEGDFKEDGCRNSDSFCGTLSISSGLYRRSIPYIFLGIIFPEETIFLKKISSFIKTIFAIKGFKNSKVGILGPRPYPFETCTINEMNLINKFGIRVVPISLLLINEMIAKIKDNDEILKSIIDEIKSRADCNLIKDSNLRKLAKMELILTEYVRTNDLTSLAISCWPDMPSIIGVSPCLTAGRLTEKGIPTACEADIYGALTMLIQYLISSCSNVPHFIDWTIQSQTEENSFLSWHCGNAPMCLAKKGCRIKIRENSSASITFGKDNTEGAVEFQLKDGIVSLNRLIEYNGSFKMLVTNGKIINKPMDLRGSWAWVKVKDLQKLYKILIMEGFIHHASLIYGDCSEPIISFCEMLDIEKIIV